MVRNVDSKQKCRESFITFWPLTWPLRTLWCSPSNFLLAYFLFNFLSLIASEKCKKTAKIHPFDPHLRSHWTVLAHLWTRSHIFAISFQLKNIEIGYELFEISCGRTDVTKSTYFRYLTIVECFCRLHNLF